MAKFFWKIINLLLLQPLKWLVIIPLYWLLYWLFLYLLYWPLYWLILRPLHWLFVRPVVLLITKIIKILVRAGIYKKKQIFLTLAFLPFAAVLYVVIVSGLGVVFALSLVLGLIWWVADVAIFRSIRKNVKQESKASANTEPTQSRDIDISNKGLDDGLLLASFAAIQSGVVSTEMDEAVLLAFQRFSSKTQDLESTQNYLNGLSEDQITGVVSNVKGILHEVEFVNFENMDGDSITAEMFQKANHKGFDVVMNDSSMGTTWEAQLKTTDNPDYVQEWIKQYPDGEILVSQEIADKLGLETSGFSNQELTVRVEDFIDQLTATGLFSSVWSLFPALPLISALVILYKLRRRYKAGDISKIKFIFMTLKATGFKITKFAFYMFLMAIPVVNIAVGILLTVRFLDFINSSIIQPSIFGIKEKLSTSDYLKPINQINRHVDV